jgi:predicted FMN-binding regulatory protein PaiB
MLEGFVALTLEVGEITAKSKSSQNRLPRDQLGVMEGLGADPATSEAAQVIATRLGGLRA